MYHGIVIDKEFKDQSFPDNFKIFAKKQDGPWGIYGIEIEDSQLEESIIKIQENMEEKKSWYAHLYNNEKLIVVFKNKVIEVKPDKYFWKPIIDYGKELGIPVEQLDFQPNCFKDEIHYFSRDNLK